MRTRSSFKAFFVLFLALLVVLAPSLAARGDEPPLPVEETSVDVAAITGEDPKEAEAEPATEAEPEAESTEATEPEPAAEAEPEADFEVVVDPEPAAATESDPAEQVDEELSLDADPAGEVEVLALDEDDPAADPDLLADDEAQTKATTSLSQARVAAIAKKAYTGKAITPTPKVTLAGKTLVRNTDYTLSYKNNTKPGTATVIVTGKGAYSGTKKATFKIVKPSVLYKTRVQNYGWERNRRKDGAVSGTTGKSKRLEGFYVVLSSKPVEGSVAYRTYIQNYGWEKNWRKDGKQSGTTGQTKCREAIQVKLTGKMAQYYDVYYRVYAQSFGWMGWAKNGASAGTNGYGYRLEAIQITLVPKGGKAPAATFRGVTRKTSAAFKSKSASKNVRGPKSAGALSVKGLKLVDKNGKAIQLRGVSTHGLAWYPGYVNNACFKELRTKWGANVVRLAMYTQEYGGYCSGGNKADLRALVKKGVNLAKSNDLYVIVDWHILSDGNPLTHVKDAKAFFKTMSASLKDYDNVLYEICNEPNGGTTWTDIKKYANQVIPVIRANDPDAVVLVGTPTWSQEVDKAAKSPLSQKNVMYTMHFYAATHKDDMRNRLATAVRGGLPVFVSEFGICDASGNGSIDKSSANSWMSTMNNLGVSWCMWSLCNKAESASIIRSSCSATSGFKTGDLTTSGTWLLKALDGTLPAGTVAQGTSAGQSGSQSGSQAAAAQVVRFSSGNFACTATLTGSWDAGGGKTCYQYDLSIRNTGAARTSWSVVVPFNKSLSFSNGWNGSFAASGSKLTIRNADYNGSIGKGETLTGIGFQVKAASGLKVQG